MRTTAAGLPFPPYDEVDEDDDDDEEASAVVVVGKEKLSTIKYGRAGGGFGFGFG